MNRRQIKALEALAELENRPGGTSSVELALSLSLSRDSVHQLLLPLVRNGWVVAGRGRLGGYRVTPAASGVPILDIVSAFSSRGESSPNPGTSKWIRRLENRAEDAYREVLSSVTVAEMAEAVRAEREALTWAI